MASDGVFRVWSSREFSRAVARSSDWGIQRPEAPMRPMRSSAAGEQHASHSPPSEARHFWGAK